MSNTQEVAVMKSIKAKKTHGASNGTSRELDVRLAGELFPLLQGEELYLVSGPLSASVRPSALSGFAWLSVIDVAKSEQVFLKKPVALAFVPIVLEHLGVGLADAFGTKKQGEARDECPLLREPSKAATRTPPRRGQDIGSLK